MDFEVKGDLWILDSCLEKYLPRVKGCSVEWMFALNVSTPAVKGLRAKGAFSENYSGAPLSFEML